MILVAARGIPRRVDPLNRCRRRAAEYRELSITHNQSPGGDSRISCRLPR